MNSGINEQIISTLSDKSTLEHDLVAVLDNDLNIIHLNKNNLYETTGSQLHTVSPCQFGNFIECRNAGECPCGTSEDCHVCNFRNTVEKSRKTGKIETGIFNFHDRESYKITAIPFDIWNTDYTLLCIQDISDQQRKNSLERIFFHDILNTSSSIKLYIDLLEKETMDTGARDMTLRLKKITEHLIEEINQQKTLVNAEKGILKTEKHLLESHMLLQGIAGQFRYLDWSRDISIEIDDFSENISFIADMTLLGRVLANLVKNALEASGPGDIVRLKSVRKGGKIEFSVSNPARIDDNALKGIFKRGFSTKGQGRGLGTYSVRLLAEDYLNGGVSFSSSRENGTVFRVSLPVKPL